MNKHLKFVILGSSLLSLMACETTQDQNIEQARQCSDSAAQLAASNPAAAASMATGCETLIANIQTQEAGLIGGGLVLLEEQKTSSLTSIETAVSAGTGAVATSISFLVFSTQAHVNSIAYYAALAGDPNTSELANIVALAYFANASAALAGGISPSTPTATLVTDIQGLETDPTNGPAAAQAVLSAQANACASGSSTLCTDLTNAIGGATTQSGIFANIAAYINGGG
jgi:hypothetical protein